VATLDGGSTVPGGETEDADGRKTATVDVFSLYLPAGHELMGTTMWIDG